MDLTESQTFSPAASLQGERTPLLAHDRPNIRRDAWRSLLPLLCIFMLERCTYYEYLSSLTDFRRRTNNESYEQICNSSTVRNEPTSEQQSLLIEWQSSLLLQSIAFLLPLLGGYVADDWCGSVWALRIGCAIYFVGAWVLASWYASHAPGLMSACQVVLALAAGLLRPSLLVLTIESGRPLMGPRKLCQLYYLWEAIGQTLGYLLAYVSDLMQVSLANTCVPTTLLMLLLTIGTRERPHWDPSLFELPSWPTFKRIIVVAAPLILVSCSVTLGYYTLSVWEVSYAEQCTSLIWVRSRKNLLMLCYSTSLVTAVAALMLLSHFLSAFRLPEARIGVGVLAAMLGQFVNFGLDWVPDDPLNKDSKFAAYVCLNVIYAVAEAFAITTANEIAFRIAPVEIRTFMVGLFMGLWGSGYSFSSLMAIFSYKITEGHDSEYFHHTTMWVHLSLGVMLLGALLYFKRCGINPMRWLLDIEATAETRQEDETRD